MKCNIHKWDFIDVKMAGCICGIDNRHEESKCDGFKEFARYVCHCGKSKRVKL